MSKTNQNIFTPEEVKHIAILAHIPLTPQQEIKLAQEFTETLRVVDRLNEVDVNNIEPTNQVTGLTNIFREDVVDTKRMFSQELALSNAKHTHNGFFVVNQILDQT